MNAPYQPTLTLDRLSRGSAARIVAIDWATLDSGEANRLRHFGFDDGIRIETVQQGPFGRDPIAVRVGRMTVAIRRRHAAAITVQPDAR